MILKLKNDLSAKNISFFLFQFQKSEDYIKIAKENGLPLISLSTVFTEEGFYYKDGHINGNGGQKVADQFLEILTKYKLIPENIIYFQVIDRVLLDIFYGLFLILSDKELKKSHVF
ncbi:MAG: hypothetical protein LUD02_14195 [Tannerellaceae bacterium]|nr:hypothetical protein [Tannerellaceae bacterium]